jgi:imidazolonepropionase-like amidohydrolase
VHLSFADPDAVVRGGVTTVLDLGAPLDYAFAPHPPVRSRVAGPLLTAPRGYPTRSWGSNGYGLEVRDAASAREAVAMLADRGAAVIKLAIEPAEGPVPDIDVLRASVEAAHVRGLRAAAHALGVDAVRLANDAGVDILAHTPIEPLPSELIRSVAGRGVAVISTVRAFGARRSTRDNLAALAAAGCPIAYGTDLGNGDIRPGLDADELALIEDAVGDRALALGAATGVAGSLAGAGGRIAAGLPADLVWIPSFAGPADLQNDLEVRIGA